MRETSVRPRACFRLRIVMWVAPACLPALICSSREASGQQLPGTDSGAGRHVDPGQSRERTSFQSGARWDPMLQLPADVALCYGVGPDLGPRIQQWMERGFVVHVMTGVAWGIYQDYLYGRFDGKNHVDEAQTGRFGNVISHGGDV